MALTKFLRYYTIRRTASWRRKRNPPPQLSWLNTVPYSSGDIQTHYRNFALPAERKERSSTRGMNSNTGNNSSEKRLAPTVSPKSNRPQIVVRRLLKPFSRWCQARKSNNSKPRGRAVALHECCLAPSSLEPPNITPQFRLYGDQGQRLSLWDTSFRSG